MGRENERKKQSGFSHISPAAVLHGILLHRVVYKRAFNRPFGFAEESDRCGHGGPFISIVSCDGRRVEESEGQILAEKGERTKDAVQERVTVMQINIAGGCTWVLIFGAIVGHGMFGLVDHISSQGAWRHATTIQPHFPSPSPLTSIIVGMGTKFGRALSYSWMRWAIRSLPCHLDTVLYSEVVSATPTRVEHSTTSMGQFARQRKATCSTSSHQVYREATDPHRHWPTPPPAPSLACGVTEPRCNLLKYGEC